MNTLYYCPGCGHGVELPFPVEPLYDRQQVMAMVPCTKAWLKNRQNAEWMGEPIYMLDSKRRPHRMFTATDVRRLRVARFSKHDRRGNKEELPFE